MGQTRIECDKRCSSISRERNRTSLTAASKPLVVFPHGKAPDRPQNDRNSHSKVRVKRTDGVTRLISSSLHTRRQSTYPTLLARQWDQLFLQSHHLLYQERRDWVCREAQARQVNCVLRARQRLISVRPTRAKPID